MRVFQGIANPAFLLKILSSYRFLNMFPLWLWQKANRTFFVLTSLLPVTFPSSVGPSGSLPIWNHCPETKPTTSRFRVRIGENINGEIDVETKHPKKQLHGKLNRHAVPRAIETGMNVIILDISYPIGSMYGILFTYKLDFMVNVGKYTIHGSDGYL